MEEEEADDDVLLQALDNGAFLVVKRKLTNDFVINARQHVIRERIHKSKKFRISSKSETKEVEGTSRNTNVIVERKNVGKCYGNGNPDVELLENERVCVKRRVYTKRNVSVKKKISVEWTKELHSKFLRVVQELGEGNCFPVTILDAMGVPGLTRMQVASHLQKCRHGWQLARKRGTPSSSNSDKIASNNSKDVGKFGRMPLVATHVGNPEDSNTSTRHATFSQSRGKTYVNLKNNQSFGESSLMGNFELENFELINSLPSTHHGSIHHNFPPKQASDDLFDFMNGMEGDETFLGIQHHPIELNDNYKMEQVSQNYGLEMPNWAEEYALKSRQELDAEKSCWETEKLSWSQDLQKAIVEKDSLVAQSKVNEVALTEKIFRLTDKATKSEKKELIDFFSTLVNKLVCSSKFLTELGALQQQVIALDDHDFSSEKKELIDFFSTLVNKLVCSSKFLTELGALQQQVIALDDHDFSVELKRMNSKIPDELLRLHPVTGEVVDQASADFTYKDWSYLSCFKRMSLSLRLDFVS
ncbi:two-component response regulator ARR14 [Artemisia annua]|uniref:Two-component response regulator ARR14 n=1 Tax=Artemisia annua TaxID=35608 RepID=A0A2U1LI33_ARTAN|nr:two-component response regulator ARR14 [Artemisia annua]